MTTLIKSNLLNLKWRQTIGYNLAFIGLGFMLAILGPTLPYLAEHAGTGLREISYIFVGRSLGYLSGAILSGRLYDQMSGHILLTLMFFLLAGLMALIPLLSQLWLLVILLYLIGLGEGTVDVGGNILLLWIHRENVDPFMNALHFFFGIGAFIAPLLVAVSLRYSGDINWAYWTVALLIFPLAFWFLRLPSPETRQNDSELNQPEVGQPFLVLLFACFFLLYVGVEASTGGWIYTYAVALNLNDEATAAYLTSAFWGALTVGRLLSIPLAMRFRPSHILLGDLSGALLSTFLIILWPQSRLILWIGVLGLGFSLASIFPTLISFAEKRMRITGRITGWFFVGASSGAMSVPWLIGQFFEQVGPKVVMWILFSLLIAALGLYFFLLNYTTRRHLQNGSNQ